MLRRISRRVLVDVLDQPPARAEVPSWDELLRSIEQRLAAQGIRIPPPPLVLNDLVTELVRARGRPIHTYVFRQAPGEETERGYTIQHPEVDVVCYQEGLSRRSTIH